MPQFDTNQFLYNPAGAALKDLRGRFGAGDAQTSTTASDTYAALTREQYANYVANFQPLDTSLVEYATGQNTIRDAIGEAREDVTGAFDRQAASTQRRLRSMGVSLNPDEQRASDRSLGIAKSLAEVGAINNTRDTVAARQMSILGNPAPSINPREAG